MGYLFYHIFTPKSIVRSDTAAQLSLSLDGANAKSKNGRRLLR
jgi:hypothetical protein